MGKQSKVSDNHATLPEFNRLPAMKNNAAIIALAGGLLIGAAVAAGLWFVGYGTNGEPKALDANSDATSVARETSAPDGGGIGQANTDRRVLYLHDPMVPGTKFDKPGKSPFMDMQLVPVYADQVGDEGDVSISSRTVQNLGIRTVEVTQGNTDVGFNAVGAVSIDERTITTVESRVHGYIERLFVRAQYDDVTRGQPLAEIYAPDWLAAEEEFLALKSSALPGAEELAQAARQRLLLLGISEKQIETIAREGKANPRVTLFAPKSGVVWELGTREGQAVSPGMTLFRLASLETVWVNAEVPETQATVVTRGIAVEGRTAAMPDKVFKGQVAALLPDIDQTTRTLRARIVLANPGRALQPGMFAKLNFLSGGRQAVMVPSEAVIYTGTRDLVIVAEGEGKFRPADVQIGRASGEMTEIRSGLSAGQKVVASGQFLIDSEASLKGVLARLNDSTAGASATGSPAPTSQASASKVHRGRGRVLSIEGGNKVLIEHGAIPDAHVGATVTRFWAPKAGLPSNVEVGDTVSFEFIANNAGEFDLTAITPETPVPTKADHTGVTATRVADALRAAGRRQP